jgi:hypothetical protein
MERDDDRRRTIVTEGLTRLASSFRDKFHFRDEDVLAITKDLNYEPGNSDIKEREIEPN